MTIDRPERDRDAVNEELRDRLVAQRRALVERIARTGEDLARLGRSVPEEMEEEAQETQMAQPLGTLDAQGRAALAAIEDAIVRLERGDYGCCETCGEPIPVERLRAVPTARECIEDAERRERLSRAASPPGVERTP